MEIQLLCLYSNHNNSQILGLCLNEDCCSQRAYCKECIETLHFNHLNDLCSLDSFGKKIQEASLTLDSLSKRLEQVKSYIESITKCQKQLFSFLQSDFYNLSHQRFNPIIDQLIAIKKIDKELIPMLGNICKDFQPMMAKFLEIQDYQNKQEFCRVQSQIVEPLNIVFHNTMDSIYVFDQGKKAMKSTLGYQFVICHPVIPKQKRVCFTFEILSVGLRTALGVCHKDINIKIQQLKEGHGSYIMVNSGNCFESSKPQGTKTTFEFEKGSKILVEVNTIQKKIIWKNLDNLSEYSVAIDTSKDLYPCLRLGCKSQQESSSVGIIDNYNYFQAS
ncbi:unnamed protein product (macronuclear) [Paramecium tetraurelia]|uniref:B box-type domain-containing protein n=1 Tax=Paramecium tetraurelia TaxID=5888 RepID=A0C308_PARTE|nr:uncharacterized protein GSPATT00034653001 [Paramecium tetraurelia]CAK65175.1 unnamed protein product [Paramecium tetraurelia]|eukprot:XP_001432572.1 hypothetical protein (macronuclear) [Paramecium tetraurelia strain d4-2]